MTDFREKPAADPLPQVRAEVGREFRLARSASVRVGGSGQPRAGHRGHHAGNDDFRLRRGGRPGGHRGRRRRRGGTRATTGRSWVRYRSGGRGRAATVTRRRGAVIAVRLLLELRPQPVEDAHPRCVAVVARRRLAARRRRGRRRRGRGGRRAVVAGRRHVAPALCLPAVQARLDLVEQAGAFAAHVAAAVHGAAVAATGGRRRGVRGRCRRRGRGRRGLPGRHGRGHQENRCVHRCCLLGGRTGWCRSAGHGRGTGARGQYADAPFGSARAGKNLTGVKRIGEVRGRPLPGGAGDGAGRAWVATSGRGRADGGAAGAPS